VAVQAAQRKIQAGDTRARLFAAAVRLFAQHGYADTTVDRIAKEAGVAKGTFFVHFATKDAVVTELVRNQVRAARKMRDRTLTRGGSPVDALRASVMSLGEQAAANRGLSRAVVSANLFNPILGGFAESVFGGMIAEMMDDVKAAQKARLLNASVDPETIASTLIMSYLGATLYFATAPRSKPLLALLEPIVDSNIAGFTGLTGLAGREGERPRKARAKAAKSAKAADKG